MYAGARNEYKTSTSPVIISMLGAVFLFQGDQSERVDVTTPEWELLKTVDHVPLGVFVGLVRHVEAPLRDDVIAELQEFKQRITAAESEILAAHLSAESLARQKVILDGSKAFIDQCVQNRCVTPAQLDAFARGMSKLVLANADEAEEIELGIVDRTVRRWRQKMSAAYWKNLRVVVSDVHMARIQEREMLYFAALLGEKQEGRRLIFMENGDDPQKAMDLLATHRLDEQIGIGFFRDRDRMHRDLLGDAAKLYIRKHPPSR
jgi:hypothetical protein